MLFCQVAYLLDIWVIQVLENFVKKGIFSWAEIMDVVMVQWVECVMFNKGVYIIQVIGLLDFIFCSMGLYQEKNVFMFFVMEGVKWRK